MSAELLDLVRQYGELNAAAALYPKSSAPAQADALFARIAALVPQQPVQARDRDGLNLWQHGCRALDVSIDGMRPSRCNFTCDKPGPWLPLLVGGDPAPLGRDGLPLNGNPDDGVAPEPTESRAAYWERRFNEEATSHDEDALKILALHRECTEAASARDAAIDALIKTRADRESAERKRDQMQENAEAWQREAEKFRAERDKARAFESAYRSALKIMTESHMALATARYPAPEGEPDATPGVIEDLSDSLLSVIMQRDNAQALADQRGARLTALKEDRRWALVEVERLTGLVRQRFGEVPT